MWLLLWLVQIIVKCFPPPPCFLDRPHRTIPPGNTIVGLQRALYDNPQRYIYSYSKYSATIIITCMESRGAAMLLWTDLPAASQALPDVGLMPAPTRFPWPAREAAERVWWTTPCTACPMNTCVTAVGLGLGRYSGFPWCITRATEWRGLERVWGLTVGPPSDQGHTLFVWNWQRPRQCTTLSIRD